MSPSTAPPPRFACYHRSPAIGAAGVHCGTARDTYVMTCRRPPGPSPATRFVTPIPSPFPCGMADNGIYQDYRWYDKDYRWYDKDYRWYDKERGGAAVPV